jgi:ketosteroid isomerase-like protein
LAASYIGVSGEQAEIVRAQWEAYNRGDMDAFLAPIDPDCEFHEDPAFPEAGVYRGPEEIRAYISQFREAMADHSFEIEEVRDLGSAVIALLHERARGRASGVEVDLRPAFVCRFRGQKIVWARAYLDRAQALADAGQRSS